MKSKMKKRWNWIGYEMENKSWEEFARGSFGEREKLLTDDRDLVRRAKEKKDVFEELYRKYLQKVYTYVYYRVGTVEDAEDITGNVFLHALLNLERYEDRGLPFSSWLLRIAHNMVANWYRSKSRETWSRMEIEEEIVGDCELPDEMMEREEERKRVMRAIASLPPEKQQILILRFAEGMKHKEIAEVVGRSTGAVKVIVHRSLLNVHRNLMQMEKEER